MLITIASSQTRVIIGSRDQGLLDPYAAMTDKLTPPKPAASDDAHRLARAAAGMVLPAGGDLLEAVIGPPLAKRMDAWRDLIAERVQELLDREQLTAESLQEDPQFIDTVMHASRAAAYTSSEEKRQALATAIYNAGARRGPVDDERIIFIRLIDELTEWHIRLLVYISENPTNQEYYNELDAAVDPSPSARHELGTFPYQIEQAFSQLQGRADFYLQLRREMIAHGLLAIEEASHGGPSTESTKIAPRGKALLEFITHPELADA